MEEADKGWLMIRTGVSGLMFLLVPAHPGIPLNGCCVVVVLFTVQLRDQSVKSAGGYVCLLIFCLITVHARLSILSSNWLPAVIFQ